MYNTKYHTEDLNHYSFLITGGAGFIGSNLVEYLLKYKAGKVRILDNFSTGFHKNIDAFKALPNFELIEGDIRNQEICKQACEDIDYVSHQAALGSVPRSILDPITTNDVNISGFLNMLVAARDQKVKKMVYAASSSTYGDSKELPKREENIGKPLSPYAVTKYVNELYADVFNRIYDLDTIGLRYFNVFGPRQNPNGAYAAVIPLFIQSLLENNAPFVNGDGDQTRDFTYIENAVQANIKAMFCNDKSAINQVLNIAVGERNSVNEMFEILRGVEDKQIRLQYRDARLGDVRDSLADISKARTLIDYSPSFLFRDGLLSTYDWYRNNQTFIKK
jgi:UDP-N-acetylglucosamine 4-epimerase